MSLEETVLLVAQRKDFDVTRQLADYQEQLRVAEEESAGNFLREMTGDVAFLGFQVEDQELVGSYGHQLLFFDWEYAEEGVVQIRYRCATFVVRRFRDVFRGGTTAHLGLFYAIFG